MALHAPHLFVQRIMWALRNNSFDLGLLYASVDRSPFNCPSISSKNSVGPSELFKFVSARRLGEHFLFGGVFESLLIGMTNVCLFYTFKNVQISNAIIHGICLYVCNGLYARLIAYSA